MKLVALLATSALALVGASSPKPVVLTCPAGSTISSVVGGGSALNVYGPFTQATSAELSCEYAKADVEYMSGISASFFTATHESLQQFPIPQTLVSQLATAGYWEVDPISTQVTETWLVVLDGTTQIEIGGDNVTNAADEALLSKILG